MQTLDLETLFQQLLHYRNQTADFSTLGPWLRDQIKSCAFPELNHLPLAAAAYTRTWIAREAPTPKSSLPQQFEALIMRWDNPVKTSIHGHPAFSFYHVISGIFEVELFSLTTAKGLNLETIQRLYPSDTTWFLGQVGRYDNFIHRVTCLEAGFTFHVYSEDAQKGVVL